MRFVDPRLWRRYAAVGGVLLAIGSNALAVMLATAILGAAGRGRMVALCLIPNVVHVLFGLGLPNANVYEAARGKPAGGLAANSAVWSIVVPPVLAVLTLAIPAAWLTSVRLGFTASEFRMAVALAFALMGYQQLAGVLQGQGRYGALMKGRAVQAIAVVALTLLAPQIGLKSSFGLFLMWVASYAAGALAFVWMLRRGFRLSPHLLVSSVRYGVRAMWTQIWEFANLRGDQVLVAALGSARALGIYSLAVSLSEVLLHVPNAISMVVFSDTAAGDEQALHTVVARDSAVAFGLTCVAGAVLALATAYIVTPLLNLSGPSLWITLAIMVVPVSALASGRMLGAFLMGRGRPELPGIAAAVSFVVTLLADIALVPKYGAIGAGIGVSAGYLSAALIMLVMFSRHTATLVSLTPHWSYRRGKQRGHG